MGCSISRSTRSTRGKWKMESQPHQPHALGAMLTRDTRENDSGGVPECCAAVSIVNRTGPRSQRDPFSTSGKQPMDYMGIYNPCSFRLMLTPSAVKMALYALDFWHPRSSMMDETKSFLVSGISVTRRATSFGVSF